MNAAQRKFLIEKLQSNIKSKISSLDGKRMEYPSISNYLFKAILNDELELKSNEVILSTLKEKAMKAKEGTNWLSEDRMGWEMNRTVKIDLDSIFVRPEDYHREYEIVKNNNAEVAKEIESLRKILNSIEIRIQLASDKTLKSIINEVDDMGDITLVDAKLQLSLE